MWLIKFEKNWADEFDCQQFEVVDSKDTAEAYVGEAIQASYFGTNQGWEEGEITRKSFEIRELKSYEHKALEELFGATFGQVIRFGTGPL